MRSAATLSLFSVTELAAWRLILDWEICRGSRRLAVLVAAVLSATALSLATEGLSLLHWLSAVPVGVLWGAVAATLVGLNLRRRRSRPALRIRLPDLDAQLAIVLASAVVLVLVGITALAAPPNTWDAMSYHLPRVMHWVQDRSVAPFATHVTQQVKAPPGAEYIMLHLFLVSGSDRLAGLVQWSALCVAAVGASFAAKLLGGNRTGQVVAAAFVTALPMAVVEGSGSKNDVVVAAWVVCCASFVLLFRAEPSLLVALLVGLSAGLAVFTKDTAYLFVAPLLLWFASLIAVRGGARKLAVAALAILVLNAGLYARNFATFGSPLGPGSEQTLQGRVTYTNSTFGPRALASNVIREAALQLVPPWDPAVRAEERAVHDMHRVLGISENFGATTWEGQTFGLPSRSQQLFEDKVPNALPFTLVLLASAIFLFRRRRFGEAVLPYAACVAGGALLFCIVLRWQPWNSRLQTPLLVLAAPFAAIVITRYAGRRGALAVGALLLVAVTPWLLLGKPRALVGTHSVLSVDRTAQYFANGGSFERPFRRAATRIAERGCTDVGLITDANTFEYPLWPLLRSSGERRVRVEDIDVHNETSTYPPPRDWSPCAVVVVEPLGGSGLPVPGTLRVAGVTLRPAWAEGPIRLFLPTRV